MENNELAALYKIICNEYVRKFAKKQGLRFEYWIADNVGETACFNADCSFNFSDIVYDIDTRQPKGLIIKWQNESIEHYVKYKETYDYANINYYSYSKGLRFKE